MPRWARLLRDITAAEMAVDDPDWQREGGGYPPSHLVALRGTLIRVLDEEPGVGSGVVECDHFSEDDCVQGFLLAEDVEYLEHVAICPKCGPIDDVRVVKGLVGAITYHWARMGDSQWFIAGDREEVDEEGLQQVLCGHCGEELEPEILRYLEGEKRVA